MKPSIRTTVSSAMLISGVALAISGCLPPVDPDPYVAEVPSDNNYPLAAPSFAGSTTGTPNLAANVVSDHPFLAGRGHNGMHSDAYMSGTHPSAGPDGSSGFDISSASMRKNEFFPGGECGNTVFTSSGILLSYCADFTNNGVYALKRVNVAGTGEDRFELLDSFPLPNRESSATLDIYQIMNDTSGGAYFHLDNQERIVLADSANTLRIIETSGGTLTQVLQAPIGFHVTGNPGGTNHDVTDIMPDWNVAGVYWFITRQGKVGTIDTNNANAVVSIDFAGEEFQNAMAMDSTGVYAVSDFKMYKLTLNGSNAPQFDAAWPVGGVAFDRGDFIKPGQINQGSGTTPTLMGANDDYLAITDNADPTNVVIMDRVDGTVICKEPVFSIPVPAGDTSGLTYASSSDNSLIGYHDSVVVENNYGYDVPTVNNWTQPGLMRVDVVAENLGVDDNCVRNADWIVSDANTTASQTTVPKLSLGSGLVYVYTREEIAGVGSDPDNINQQAYYFGALDFETGDLVFKVLTGTGSLWNNNYAPITIPPNESGVAYIGIYRGIMAIRDQ